MFSKCLMGIALGFVYSWTRWWSSGVCPECTPGLVQEMLDLRVRQALGGLPGGLYPKN